MRRTNTTKLKALFIALLMSAGIAQAQEVKLLWSDTHNQVLARHNAALYTPVAEPANWVNEKYNIAEAQQAVDKLYPNDRSAVKPIVVEPSRKDQATVDEITINGRKVPLTERW